MKKNLNAWKRTISSVAALAIVLSLGMPFTTAFADETGTPSESSSALVESAAPESSSASSEAQPSQSEAKWEDTAAAAIGTVSGRDGAEKVYNYLRGLEGHKDAQSFQTLANKCGLTTSKVITGTLSGAAHSWNVVQVDGVWYAVDVEKGVLLAGAKTLLADGKTAFEDAYKTSDTTVLSGESHKIVVTITPMVGLKKGYGDADPSFVYTPSINIGLDGVLSRAPGEDLGEYAYTLEKLKVKDSANAGKYQLELAKNASKFKIEKKTLEIESLELESDSKAADDTPSVPVRKVILKGNIPESEVSVNMAGVSAAVSSNEAGVYSNITLSGLTLQGTKAGNYTIGESAVVNKSFTIKVPEPPAVVDGAEETNGKPDENQPGGAVSDSSSDGNKDNTSDSSNTTPPENSEQQSTSSSDSSQSSTSSEENSSSSTGSASAPSESSGSSSGESSESNSGNSSSSGNTSGGSDSEDSQKDENVTGPSEGETPAPAEKIVVKIKFENQTKIYGEKDPEPKYTVIQPEGEELTVTGTPKREVKEGSENAGFHPYTTVEGLTVSSDQYKLELAEDSTGGLTIIQRPVAVSFRSSSFDVDLNEKEKTAFVEYDGKPKALEGYYPTVRGDECKVKVLYNGLETVPTEKGTYSLSVVVEDSNYSLTSEALAIDKMVITEKLFTPVDQSRTIAKNDINEKSIPLSSFGIPSEWYDKVQITNLEGELVVEDYNSGKLYVKDGNLYFRLRSGVTAGQQGKVVLWIPEINIYARLTVTVGEQGFEVSVQNSPSSVILGNDISVSSSSFRLAFKYDNGKTEYESITRDMLSGYDKTAKGTNSIGNKIITVTSKTKEPGATATFKIKVNDRIIGLEVGEPDQTHYYTSDSRLDLTGGWVALKMQSGIPQDSVKLGFTMINRDHSILKKPGEYSVRVKYKDYTLSDAFTFTVERDSYWGFDDMYPAGSTTSTPDSGEFGVSLNASDLKGEHSRGNIYLVVEESWDDELDDYMYQRSFDDYELMDLHLYDDYTGEEVEIRSGREVTVYIPYPQGTSSSRHTFTVYHLVNGRVRTEKVTALSNHLKVSVSSFSPFAVAWKQKSSISGGNSSGGSNLSAAVQHQQEMQEFWNDVTDTLKDTKSGRSVLVDAGDYDYVPSKVLKAIKDRDVTLKIENDTTKTIVLNGKKPPITGSLKTSYTMSELYDAVKGNTNSSTNSSSKVINNNTSASSLEALWSGVVKSLKSYQEGTSITVNAKDNSSIPKTVLDAVRGRNVTVKLKSESHPTITFNGKEMPVDLPSQRQYTLQELYDATVPESVSDMEDLWSGVTDDLKSYKAGAKVTISAGNNTFIPNTVLDAIRGRNVTIKIKSDYTSDLITLNGASLPKSLSGEKYYSISQLANRAKTGGTIIYPSGGNTQQNNVQSSWQGTGQSSITSGGSTGTTTTSQQVVSSQGGTGSSQSSSSQSSAVAAVSGSIGSGSSQSSSKITAPSDTIIPPINGEGDTVPSIEETKKGDSILPKVIIGVMIFAILIVAGILIFLLSGTRSRPR